MNPIIYYNYRDYRTRYAKGYRGHSQRTIGERPDREYYRDRSDRERNQVNRGRYNRVEENDRRGDDSYDKHGKDKSYEKHGKDKSDRGHGND